MRALAALALAACGHAAAPAAPVASAAPADAGPSERCLPMVNSCGCVYDCVPGVRSGVDWNLVWLGKPETGAVQPWCVDDQCTDVFMSDMACDDQCRPHPADSTCHFAGSGCESAHAAN